jgi:cobalt-precorrin 5A hydrolase
VEELLGEQKISWQDIGGAASIDLKKEEPGLLSLCRRYDLPFETYSAEQLRSVQGEFSASGFVQKTTGVDNVCERAALCMAGAHGRLVHRKYAKNGVTASLAVRDWSVRFEE